MSLTMLCFAESPILKMKLNFTASLNSSVNRKINGYNISGHCGKFLWIRIALLEKLLSKIVEDLHTNARCVSTTGVFFFQFEPQFFLCVGCVVLVNLELRNSLKFLINCVSRQAHKITW